MSIEELAKLFEIANIMGAVVVIFAFNACITILDIIWDFTAKRKRSWRDTLANISIYFVTHLLEKTAYSYIGFLCLLPIYYISPFEIPMNAWTWVLAIFAADFSYYWMHRIEHQVRILWANHSVHHSSEDYNLTIGLRLCILEGSFEWVFLIPMIEIGFNPFQAIIAFLLVAQYQHWIHTEKIQTLGWFDKIFNSPSNHRVHHGSNSQYLDKNYGGILIVWDRLFNTYEPEVEPVQYGLTENINTNNPVSITFIGLKRLWIDLKKCNHFGDKIKMCFYGLLWQPTYSKPVDLKSD